MNKRKVLGQLIRGMLILFVMAFVFVLLRSLGGPSLAKNPNGKFDNVVIGQTAIRRSGQQRVWVTRLSKSQMRQAKQLDGLVVDPNVGCKPSFAVCVLAARSQRSGIDIVYLATAPTQLPTGVDWYGGFVDPATGGVFDFLGRAYKGVRSNDERLSLELIEY